MKNPLCDRVVQSAEEETVQIEKRMSPKGALGLSPLLDARRLEYGLPDEAFTISQASFDRIFVWQIDSNEDESYTKGGMIVRPDNKRDADEKASPRGILVSAGLSALDTLRSHGYDLGHIVNFMAIQPWHLPLGFIEAHHKRLLMMRDGDLCGSEDLSTALRSGAVKVIVKVDEKGARSHHLVDEEGNAWDPVAPWISDDQ